MLGASLETYLEALFRLSQKIDKVRSIDIAKHLNFSKASVSHAIKLLRQKGYVNKEVEGFLYLTKEGSQLAKLLYERHDFFKRLLAHVGVDEKQAEWEASELNHIVSQESFECLKKEYAAQIGLSTCYNKTINHQRGEEQWKI